MRDVGERQRWGRGAGVPGHPVQPGSAAEQQYVRAADRREYVPAANSHKCVLAANRHCYEVKTHGMDVSKVDIQQPLAFFKSRLSQLLVITNG